MSFKKALKEIDEAQEQFFDRLIDAVELEEQIKRIEGKYFKDKYCGSAVDNLKAKILNGNTGEFIL